MANKIVSGKDEGDCHFHTDFAKGKVAVTIRAPLTIDKRTVEINVTDLLEIAAQITQEWIQLGREVHAKIQAEAKKGTPTPA